MPVSTLDCCIYIAKSKEGIFLGHVTGGVSYIYTWEYSYIYVTDWRKKVQLNNMASPCQIFSPTYVNYIDEPKTRS